jgi:myosin heavy chain 6/7
MAESGSNVTETNADFQAMEEKARKYQEAFEREEKMRIELEELNTKLLTEKTDLLKNLDSEKGSLSEYQEKALKLGAQKADLESQLSVSTRYLCLIPLS